MTDFPFEKSNDQDILLANAKKAVAMCKSLKPNSTPGYGMRVFVPSNVDLKQMSLIEFEDVILTSTYKLAAYLIYCRLHLSDACYENNKDLFIAYCEVLNACAFRDFYGHGNNSLHGLVDTMEILIEAPLKPYHYHHFCDNFWFYVCVERALLTLQKIANGTAYFPAGKDEQLMARAQKLLDTWNNSSSEVE